MQQIVNSDCGVHGSPPWSKASAPASRAISTPGGHVPGKAREHHRDVEAPGGQPGQIEALGAVHPDPQAARHEALHQLAMNVVLDLRAGTDGEVGEADDRVMEAGRLESR